MGAAPAVSSLKPIAFVAIFIAIVALPQIAYHVARAKGWIPRRSLTWVPAGDAAAASAWTTDETVLAARDGRFDDVSRLFGEDVDPSLVSDVRRADPFTNARVAMMGVHRDGNTTVVAQFEDDRAAQEAAVRQAMLMSGTTPTAQNDGTYRVARPAGDTVVLVVAGRTMAAFSGATEAAARARLAAAPFLMRARAAAPSSPTEGAAPEFWLYRPPVLAGLVGLLLIVSTLWFFKGASWATAVPPAADVAVADLGTLRQRLLAVNQSDVPFVVTAEDDGTLLVTWRYADARWADLARVRGVRRTHRLVLEPDSSARAVRMSEQWSALDWSAGRGGASLSWKTASGLTFFEFERTRVFGVQLDARGRFQPDLSYTWRFSAQELKAPFVAAVTGSGWAWRPVMWRGPKWLRWLTE